MIPATRPVIIRIADREINLQIPADPDVVLQTALAGEATGDRHTDPYWGLLWDAAGSTAARVLAQEWPAGWRALELGCGVGLVGIAGLMAGLQVTFSDLVPAAVQLSLQNAADNACGRGAGMVIDWCHPPDRRFDLLLASDVLYDAENHQPLLTTIDTMLADGGMVWIGDAGRANTPRFIQLARQSGWQVQLSDDKGRPLPTPVHVKFQLIQLTR